MSSVANAIIAEAQRQGLDPALALEVAQRESGMNQSAIGAAGEIGIFQLLPATAAALGVDPTDPQQNIQGGVAYLLQLLGQFGDPAKAVAGYNCGPGCVSAALAYGANWFAHIPSSTQSYVTSILGNVQSAYNASFNPAGVPPIVTGSTMSIPQTAPASSSWGIMAVAVAVIMGIGFVLSED